MKLAKIQAAFQASVLAEAPSPDFLRLLRPPTRAARVEDVFAVYHQGYRLRLAEFLAHDYPLLREVLGDEAFGAIVEAYIAAQPSPYRSARWYGAGLADFLRATPPFSQDSLACGVAALEAAMTRSFDAADATPLPVEILGVTPPDDWPRLRFGFHESIELVDLSAEALAAYEAVQTEEEAAPGEGDVAVLVWRQELEVNYRALDELEALALRELIRGATFGETCALLAFARPNENAEELTMEAANFLARWFADGLIVAAAPAEENLFEATA